MKTIPYSRQSIGTDDVNAVVKALRGDFLTQGPTVKAFEEALTKKTGAAFAVAFSSGTAALEAAYSAAGLKKGDEVITSPLTFAATANAALWAGAKVVFADVEEDSGNIDPKEVEKKITKKTKAIVPVDYGGLPARLDELKHIAAKHRVALIEDAAHSLGATFHGRRIGSIADMTMFSFHPVKSITTGEGGAITTNSRTYYEEMRAFREHGIVKDRSKFLGKDAGGWYSEMQTLGHNYRLTDIQSALGLSQLKKLDAFVSRRRTLAGRYEKAFAKNKHLIIPSERIGVQGSRHLYPIRLAGTLKEKRAQIFKALRRRGIGVQVHYIPAYLHPYYQALGYKRGLCPKAEAFYEAELSIPLFPDLSKRDQDFVIKTINALTGL